MVSNSPNSGETPKRQEAKLSRADIGRGIDKARLDFDKSKKRLDKIVSEVAKNKDIRNNRELRAKLGEAIGKRKAAKDALDNAVKRMSYVPEEVDQYKADLDKLESQIAGLIDITGTVNLEEPAEEPKATNSKMSQANEETNEMIFTEEEVELADAVANLNKTTVAESAEAYDLEDIVDQITGEPVELPIVTFPDLDKSLPVDPEITKYTNNIISDDLAEGIPTVTFSGNGERMVDYFKMNLGGDFMEALINYGMDKGLIDDARSEGSDLNYSEYVNEAVLADVLNIKLKEGQTLVLPEKSHGVVYLDTNGKPKIRLVEKRGNQVAEIKNKNRLVTNLPKDNLEDVVAAKEVVSDTPKQVPLKGFEFDEEVDLVNLDNADDVFKVDDTGLFPDDSTEIAAK